MAIDNSRSIGDRILFIVVMMQAALFVLFESATWGRYVFLILTCIAYLVVAYKADCLIILKSSLIIRYALGFICFTLASSVWAINPSDTIQKTITLIEIILCVYPVYIFSKSEKNKVYLMISALKWGGYLVALYTISYYGYEGVLYAAEAQSQRLGNSFANVNQISMCVVLACVLEFWDLVYKRSIWQIPFYIPCIIVLSATQSRKAFVFLVLGIISVLTLRNATNKRFLYSLISTCFALLLFVYLLRLLSGFSGFQGIFQRMEYLMNAFTGSGKTDTSVEARAEMIRVGLNTFFRHPIGGIGIGCTHYLINNSSGVGAYLHNNYVEMLAGGGVIGFCTYYWFHFFILADLLFGHRKKREFEVLLITWVLLILIMDFGLVTYYSKSQWLYFTIICAAINAINGETDNGDYKHNKKNKSLYIK